MSAENTQCTARARMTLAWGGDVLDYCHVHANQMVILLGKTIGAAVLVQRLHPLTDMMCQSPEPLTAEDAALNDEFEAKEAANT